VVCLGGKNRGALGVGINGVGVKWGCVNSAGVINKRLTLPASTLGASAVRR
jgi:hypothetical protein